MVKLSPKQTEAFDLAVSGQKQVIVYGGAIRGGKTFWLLITFAYLCSKYPKSRWVIIRRTLPDLKKTTFKSLNQLLDMGLQSHVKKWNQDTLELTFKNGSEILFMSENYDDDKDLNRFKGLEANGFGFDEVNECHEETFDKGIERAGSWNAAKGKPPILILATLNPAKNWVRKRIYNKWVNDELPKSWSFIPAKINDNPDVTNEYKESLLANMSPLQYQRFVEGDWDVEEPAQNPFLDDFIENKHVSPVPLKPNVHLPLILSIDFNLNPFCAIFAQEFKGETFVLEEISIENGNISKMCDAIRKYMLDNGFSKAKLRVTGDAMGNRGEISQRDNASLYIQIMRELGIAKTQFEVKSNPKHSNSRADCNTVLRRLKVLISPNCKGLISDCLKVECGADGEILKKNRNKLEQRADFLDCFRYLCNTYLKKYI
jgi:hypothetical protein